MTDADRLAEIRAQLDACDRRPAYHLWSHQAIVDLLRLIDERDAAMHDDRLIEALAAWDHRAWAGWTRHLLDRLTPDNIARWRRQIATAYADLSEDEQESDRREAREILAVIETYLRRADP